ncbi:MAG: regulatory signaling modulator protein AmpE [Gammaproteobacteria bacterium]|nr:regulatory signaling modulator protein AmpE [Gammaproteobacteria bacterium]
MKLIALLLGLFLEKVSTSLFDLREMRWLDGLFDKGLTWIGDGHGIRAHLVTVALVILPVLPVLALAWWADDRIGGLMTLVLSVVVLFFSFGPRDLASEVDEFAAAAARGDELTINRVAKELLEFEPPSELSKLGHAVASAVFIQSSNRTFGVILWFVLLGPVGAWLFRVTDLMRRRAHYESQRQEESGAPEAPFMQAVHNVHGVLSWLPSRLAAMSFALAGSFEPATTAWKEYYAECAEHFFEVNEDIIAHAGCGALDLETRSSMSESAVAGALGSLQLIKRSMVVWLVVIALLTIAGAAI